MKSKTWLIAGAAVVALGVVLGWAFAPRPVEVEIATVRQGRFETTVDEDGKTRLAERYVVAAPLAGVLSRISLREGDAVAAGAAVASLTPALPAMLDDRSQRELRARVEGAQDAVQRSTIRISRAQVALEQVANETRRSEQLAQQGFIAPTKLETDRLAVRAAQQEVQSASVERDIAGHDLEQARAALGVAQRPARGAGAAFVVRAPIAGQVLRVLQPSETAVPMGTPLLELGDTGRLEIVAELLTTDALATPAGSRVLIERWGGPALLEGRVRLVEPAAFTKVSALGVEEQRVRVLIDISSPRSAWQALGDGFRVGLRIVTLDQPQAVQVPVSAVFPLPTQAPSSAAAPTDAAAGAGPAALDPAGHAVFVVDGGRAKLTAVTLAARNGSMAWLRSGVTPGAQVIVYPPAALRDGLRVKPRKV
jgi:HlyD family secretion protein